MATNTEKEDNNKPDAEQTSCLNCGSVVSGRYCSNCGQSSHIHRSFSAFFHDLLHGVMHFEGKFWRTLPLLVWKPGELTRRYVLGERAKFISPMSLFLFSIFLMFAVFTFIGSPFADNSETETGISQETSEQNQPLTEDANQQQDPVNLEGIINTGSEYWDEKLTWALQKINANPDLLLYKLKANGYKFAWLLIPISLPFVCLTTIGRRDWHFYDQVVFTCYSISFMTLLFVFCSLIGASGISFGAESLLMFVYAPFHMFRQLRQTYQLSRLETFIRFIFLLIFSLICLAIFFAILFTLGILS